MSRTATSCSARRARAYRRSCCTPTSPTVSRLPPMIGDIRSLNLGNSVAIVLYEALRQQDFAHMRLHGQLRNYEWK